MEHQQKSWAIVAMTCVLMLNQQAVKGDALPDAGQLLREQPQQQQLPANLPTSDKKTVTVKKRESGPSVAVKRFVFKGYEGIASEPELQLLVSDSVGKSLSMDELNAVTRKVTSNLKDHGWFLSRAYLPVQDVTSGEIEIHIEKGQCDGQVKFRRDKTVRICPSRLDGYVDQGIPSGEALNMKKLERVLLLINDLPGLKTALSISPGRTSGTSALEMVTSEGPMVRGTVWGDNQGNWYTGSWRSNAMVSLNDPLRVGDQLSMLISYGGNGLLQGRFAYSAPLGYSGLRGTLSYTGMKYKLVKGDVATSNYTGYGKIFDVGLSYPLQRSRTSNMTATMQYSKKELVDQQNNLDLHNKNSDGGSVAFNGDRYDSTLGGGLTTWNIGVTFGSLQEHVAASLSDAVANKTEGGFSRMNLGLSRLQRLTNQSTINLAWSSQVAFTNLDSSERLSLGGPYGVRAYPVGEASGDHGHLINTDLRYTLPLSSSWGTLQVGGFYDAGRITIQNTRTMANLGTATNRNTYWLQGAGLSLNYSLGKRFSLKASWAHTIGNNPGRSSSGNNSDGKDDNNQFWLQSAFSF